MTVWANGTTTEPETTSGWGWYDPYDTGHLEFHYGVDQVGFDWNCAPEAGVIVYASFNGAAGNDIRLASDRDGTIFRMLHNASLNGATVGRRYDEGDQIAPQGSTSTQSIGRHTHFEVWPGGNINNRLDPVPWMRARVGASTAGGSSRPITTKRKKVTMFCLELLGDNHYMGHLVEGGRVVLSVDNQQGLTIEEVRKGAQNQTFLFLEKFFSVGFNRADYLYSRDGWAQVSKDLLK